MQVNDLVYVVNWDKKYSKIREWDSKEQKWKSLFPIETIIPDYSDIQFNSQARKEDILWTILEIFKHPKAGQYMQEEAVRKKWGIYDKFDTNDLLVIKSNTIPACYVIISEDGVSFKTPKEFINDEFSKFIQDNLNKWDRNDITRDTKIPKEIISVFYDENDRVLFGSNVTRGLVSYSYLDAKFSKDNKHIFLSSSILYDGHGNSKCPDTSLIKPFSFIKKYFE